MVHCGCRAASSFRANFSNTLPLNAGTKSDSGTPSYAQSMTAVLCAASASEIR